MAFSYSDKNFTVVGNLCFVHIVVSGKQAEYVIPPAIGDRMLVNKIVYPYISYGEGDSDVAAAIASIDKHTIICNAAYGNGYLMVYFPIDSNK